MVKEIHLSKAEEINSPNQEAYQYKSLATGHTFVFVTRDSKKIWKTEKQRDWCFHVIAKNEALKDAYDASKPHTVIEILTSEETSLEERESVSLKRIQQGIDDYYITGKKTIPDGKEKTAEEKKAIKEAINKEIKEEFELFFKNTFESNQFVPKRAEEFLNEPRATTEESSLDSQDFKSENERPWLVLPQKQRKIKESIDEAVRKRINAAEAFGFSVMNKNRFFDAVLEIHNKREKEALTPELRKTEAQLLAREYAQSIIKPVSKEICELKNQIAKVDKELTIVNKKLHKIHWHSPSYKELSSKRKSLDKQRDTLIEKEDELRGTLRKLELSKSNFEGLVSDLLLRAGSVQRVKNAIIEAEKIDQILAEEQTESGSKESTKFTYTLKDQPEKRTVTGRMFTTEERKTLAEGKEVPREANVAKELAAPLGISLQVSQTAYQVHALSLNNFTPKMSVSKGITETIRAIGSLLKHPFVELYRYLFQKNPLREPAQATHPIFHEHLGEMNHRTIVSQLGFTASLFAELDPTPEERERANMGDLSESSSSKFPSQSITHHSQSRRMANILSVANSIGEKILQAVSDGPTAKKDGAKKRDIAVEQINFEFNRLLLDKEDYLLIPVGMGEGKEYGVHFLLFEAKGEGIGRRSLNLKHIHLSAPTLDKEPIQTVTSYDASELLRDDHARESLIRSLISLQAFEDKAHSKEKTQKATLKDHTLSGLLVDFFGNKIETEPALQKASRDPVKILFSVIRQMHLKTEQQRGSSEKTNQIKNIEINNDPASSDFELVTASKASFYQHYINFFIKYVEEYHTKLSDSELERALKSIKSYAEQLKHYREKELGLDVALVSVAPVLEYVTKKLDGLKEKKLQESKDIKALDASVHLFSTKLEPFKFDDAIKSSEDKVEVESSRASATLLNQIETLKNTHFAFSGISDVEKQTFINNAKKWFVEAKENLITPDTNSINTQLIKLFKDATLANEETATKELSSFLLKLKPIVNNHILLKSLAPSENQVKTLNLLKSQLVELNIEESEIEKILDGSLEDLIETLESTIENKIIELLDKALAEKREEIRKQVLSILGSINLMLDSNNAKAAKVACVELLRALPPPKHADNTNTFWDSLKTKSELKSWQLTLSEIAERMWEATARSGSYPLPPSEAMEFNLVLPVIQRKLYRPLFEIYQAEFDKKMSSYTKNPVVMNGLAEARKRHEDARREEIKIKETDKFKKKCQEADKEEDREWQKYQRQLKDYNKDLAKWQKYDNDPHSYSYVSKPFRPIPDESIEERAKASSPAEYLKNKAAKRAIELKEKIDEAWREDRLLQDIINIDLNQLSNNWDQLNSRSFDQADIYYLIALQGHFARIMGISAEEYAYAYYSKNNGFYDSCSEGMHSLLMQRDFSLLISSDPIMQDRYSGCELLLKEWNIKNTQSSVSEEYLAAFYVGFIKNEVYKENASVRTCLDEIQNLRDGFFTKAEEAFNHFIPAEIMPIKKVDRMKKMLDFPEIVQYFNSSLPKLALNKLVHGKISENVLNKELMEGGRLFLVAAKEPLNTSKCYALSSSRNTASGKYALKKMSYERRDAEAKKERTTEKGIHYIGETKQALIENPISLNNERNNLVSTKENRHTTLKDAAQEAILKATLLADDNGQVSYLTICKCFEFMHECPELINRPDVLHTLYDHLFQRGVAKEILENHPSYFISTGDIRDDSGALIKKGVLTELLDYLRERKKATQDEAIKKSAEESTLLILEIAERVRRQLPFAKLDDSERERISKALPKYDKDELIADFVTKLQTSQQKVAAFYVLLYFSNNPPFESESEKWKHIFKAYTILLRSPVELQVHSGLLNEVLQNIQTHLLPKIELHLKQEQNTSYRATFLNSLTGQQVTLWKPVLGKEYCYSFSDPLTGSAYEVDLRTGKGIRVEIKNGEKGGLPGFIRKNEDFQFLFPDQDPTVSSTSPNDGTQGYKWKDKTTDTEYEISVSADKSLVQFFQYQKDQNDKTQKYVFNRLKINDSLWNSFRHHRNKTIEEMVTNHGVWIKVKEKGSVDTNETYLSRTKDQKLDDPIRLYVKEGKISAASMGEGKEKRWICSGISSSDQALLSFRRIDNLLLLSRDQKHVDEIQFPDGLIIKRSEKNRHSWTISGTHFEWQLTDTASLEKEFGKNYREYILPFKNKETGEEIFYVYPYLATSLGKQGSPVKFIKKATDILDLFRDKIEKLLGQHAKDSPIPLDIDLIRGLAGMAEGVFGQSGVSSLLGDAAQTFVQTSGGGGRDGALGMVMGKLGSPEILEQLKQGGSLIEAFFIPKHICYSKGGSGEEKSTHAGFLYLAYVASVRGDWGKASGYLNLMLEKGKSSSPEDLAQLERLVIQILGFGLLFNAQGNLREGIQMNNLLEALKPSCGRQAAFQLKLIVSLSKLQSQLETQHKREFSTFARLIKNVVGCLNESEYRQAIQKNKRDLAEQGLSLDSKEEVVLQKILCSPEAIGGTIAHQVIENRPSVTNDKASHAPFRFSIPEKAEIESMLSALATNVNPEPQSIEKLHKQKGSYPKWETVLSHFWDYVYWILNHDVTVEDLTFLLHEIPENANLKNEVDSARRILLMVYRYKEKKRNNPTAWQGALEHIQNLRNRMPNLCGMKETLSAYKKDQGTDAGFFKHLYKIGKRFAQEFKVGMTEENISKIKQQELGGRNVPRSLGLDYKKASEAFLESFIFKDVSDQNMEISRTAEIEKTKRKVNADQPHVKLEKSLTDEEKWIEAKFKSVLQSNLFANFLTTLQPEQSGIASIIFKRFFIIILRSENFKNGVDEVSSVIASLEKDATTFTSRLAEHARVGQALTPESIKVLTSVFKLFLTTLNEPLKQAQNDFQTKFGLKKIEKFVWNEVEIKPGMDASKWETTFFVANDNKEVWETKKNKVLKYFDDNRENCGIELDCLRQFLNKLMSIEVEGIAQLKTEAAERIALLEKSLESKEPEITYEYDNFFEKALKQISNSKIVLPEKDTIAIHEFHSLSTKGIGKMETLANEKMRKGVEISAEELKAQSKYSLNIRCLNSLKKKILGRVKEVDKEVAEQKKKVLDFARTYAGPLGILPYFANGNKIPENQLLLAILNMVKKGEIGKLPNDELRVEFASIVSQFLLAATEKQQLDKALQVQSVMYEDLTTFFNEILERNKSYSSDEMTDAMKERLKVHLQNKANKDINWLINSRDLLRFLKEGTNRIRYAKNIGEGEEAKWVLQDPQYSVKYLIEDYLKSQITRDKAKEAIENMLLTNASLAEGKNPVRFVKVRMGIGKSTFIFPMLSRLSIEKGREPIIMTTEELLPQLTTFMDEKAFLFDFDIDYGIKKELEKKWKAHAENAADKSDEAKEAFLHKIIISHLNHLHETLYSLKKEERYVLATPARLAALRNKRIQLQDQLSQVKNDAELLRVFEALEAIKNIEGYFKRPEVIYYQDEDVNLDISFEYNYANGEPRIVEEVRFSVAEKILQTMMKDPSMQRMLVDNTLRSITDPQIFLRKIVTSIVEDTMFWINMGWDQKEWNRINKEDLIDYFLGIKKDIPNGMGKWETNKSVEQQKHRCYVAAFKSLISRTFDSVYRTHAKLERGINQETGLSVVPYRDGVQKPQTQYGEEYEVIFHHFFHYTVGSVKEKVFLDKFKELSNLSKPVNPLNPDHTWIKWAGAISEFAGRHNYYNPNPTPLNPKKVLEEYDAFSYPLPEHEAEYKEQLDALQFFREVVSQNIPFATWISNKDNQAKVAKSAEWMQKDFPKDVGFNTFINDLEHECFAMPNARIEFLRYVMTQTDAVRVFTEQIVCNSQDVTMGSEVFVGSGTGDVFALNLADAENDQSKDPNLISAETLLSLDIDEEVETFEDAFEHIKGRAKDPNCRAIINKEYDVKGNKVEKLASELRKGTERQLIFRDSMSRDKLIWNPGTQTAPISYNNGAINKKTSLAIYGPPDTRGVDFAIPKGANIYADCMVGLGLNLDDLDQSLWRMRQLGNGQKGKISCDRKMLKRVLKDNHSNRSSVTIGEVVNSIKKKSLKGEELNHQKAVIYKAKEVVKQPLDALLSKPYNLRNLSPQHTKQLAEFEAALFKSQRSLNIITDEIKWMREYQPMPKVDSIEFVRGLYRQQLNRVEEFQRRFEEEIAALGIEDLASQPLAKTYFAKYLPEFLQKKKAKNIILLELTKELMSSTLTTEERTNVYNTVDAAFDYHFHTSELHQLIKMGYEPYKICTWSNQVIKNDVYNRLKDKPEMQKIVPEAISKLIDFKRAFENISIEIANKLEMLDSKEDPKFRNFIANNTPEQIEIDPDGSTQNEQQVQQQVQQQTQVEEQLQQNLMEVNPNYNKSVNPLDLIYFSKTFANEPLRNLSSKDRLSWNHTFNSLKDVCMKKDEYSFTQQDLPPGIEELFSNVYISQAAYYLLKTAGTGAYPMVNVLVAHNKGKFSACIVTSGDWNETIHPELKRFKAGLSDAKINESWDAYYHHRATAYTFIKETYINELKSIAQADYGLYALGSNAFTLLMNDSGKTAPDPKKEEFVKLQVAVNLYLGHTLHWGNYRIEEKNELIARKSGIIKKEEETPGKKRIVQELTFVTNWINDFLSVSEEEVDDLIDFFQNVVKEKNTVDFLKKEKDELLKIKPKDSKAELPKSPVFVGQEGFRSLNTDSIKEIFQDNLYYYSSLNRDTWQKRSQIITLKQRILECLTENWTNAKKAYPTKNRWTLSDIEQWLNIKKENFLLIARNLNIDSRKGKKEAYFSKNDIERLLSKF